MYRRTESEDGLETLSHLSNNSMALKSLTLTSHQIDVPNETTSVSSNMSGVSLSATQLGNTMRRRTTLQNIDRHNEDIERNRHNDNDNHLTKKPHYERRKVFNILKHSISIVFIVIDLLLDWVMYTEMNERGTYVIVAERRRRNIEFTIECEGTGEDVQLLFLIFTIIGTLLAVLQILNIIYQIYHEIKGVNYSKRLLHEVIETFALLFFIEMSQILLIMGFYDVCTLDCVVNATAVRIIMNAIFSFIKISWRFFTRWKCCTYRKVIPETRSVGFASRWNCEQSCKCCILRWPAGEPDDSCECTCGQCLRCQQMCGCCILRCFPSDLDPPNPNICTCRCADCLSCEQPCKCCTFRCFPSSLDPPEHDICTCRCTECLSCEIPCKCCIVRCFPEDLGSPNWFDCTFGDCMKCQQTCCCCILRCCPSDLGESEACTCIFRQCTACEHMCGCFLCRCFPTELDPSKPEICECTCGKCLACEQDACCCKLRCCPSHLPRPETQWCECSCCNKNGRIAPEPMRPQPRPVPRIVIVNQPVAQPPPPPPPQLFIVRRPTPPPPPPRPPPTKLNCCDCIPSGTQCKQCCLKLKRLLIGVMIVIIFFLFALYLFLEIVQIRFVLVCVANDTLMNTIQEGIVQNFLEIYQI